MALNNTVYLGAHAPDNTSALMNIIATKPDPYKAFSQGYDDQQKRNLALQQYREAVVKADLANALYPDLLASQQAALRARVSAYNNPTNPYASPGSGVGPVDSTVDPVRRAVAAPATTTPVAPVADPNRNSENPFNTPASPLQLQVQPALPQANQMIPGLADASSYSSGDFGLDGLLG